ncbi:1-acyl-sn-glycerol-3-phosphate acyltransferase [uncultured Pseudoteredinibacter sp.]|uniref:1-acyl-sn-glycerol-3-phosphate acyltransferase n=1 Tax=uncultured Pseudoteredinibacter sp. TaxID=1641701 RepID=UPI00261B0ADA|nr:1-acyl-sn-glycerol-3-phosphate acyltransferase [uncultured Pseudoteredinibacter sp.]
MSRAASIHNNVSPMRLVGRHLLAFVSLLWVCGNLIIALSLLLAIAIVKMLLPIKAIQKNCDYLIEALYQLAVRVDSFWIDNILGIKFEIKGTPSEHPAPVVISNHHCGFDVAILQDVISGRGPLLKFLIKKEIIWLPIFGWVCFLLDFPRLNRNKKSHDREKDYATVKAATQQHGIERNSHSGALLIFPEGTRFTEAKREDQQSPYQQLLKPRSGGLKVIQEHAEPGTPLIDITIDYRSKNASLWSCLYGVPNNIIIHIHHFDLDEIDNMQNWLNQRWYEKDKLLGNGKIS